MQTYSINAKKREQTGKRAAAALRAAGNVPANLIGQKKDSESLVIDALELRKALRTEVKRNMILELEGDVKGLAMLSELQVHPITDQIIHADLLRVDAKGKVDVNVPIRVVGEAPGVVQQGGAVQTPRRDVKLRVDTQSIPLDVTISIDGLYVGQGRNASEVVLPDGAELLTTPKAPCVVVQSTRATKLMEASGEGEAEAATEA